MSACAACAAGPLSACAEIVTHDHLHEEVSAASSLSAAAGAAAGLVRRPTAGRGSDRSGQSCNCWKTTIHKKFG